MKYSVARVVFNLGVDKAFDYRIGSGQHILPGMRVWVELNGRGRMGVVTKLLGRTQRRGLNPVLEILDAAPTLSEAQLDFACYLTRYYPYPLGEFLFMMIPRKLKVRKTRFEPQETMIHACVPRKGENRSRVTYIQAGLLKERIEAYRRYIREALKEGSVILTVPLVATLKYLRKELAGEFKDMVVLSSYQRDNEMYFSWQHAHSQKKLILSTRLGLFLFPADVRLVIVEDESNSHYFSQEKPYYYFIDIARYLKECRGIDLVVGFDYPSLETYKSIKEKQGNPEIIRIPFDLCATEIISTLSFFTKKKGFHFNNLFLELVRKNLDEQKRVLILYNRRGYATLLKCSQCGHVYRCKRCESVLKFSAAADEQKGVCPFCHYQEDIPKVCPQCNSGYIRTLGLGIERLESHLKKAFPQHKVGLVSPSVPRDAEILVSTYGVLDGPYLEANRPDAVFVLDSDHSLVRIDFEATLQLYIYLRRLAAYTRTRVYIFTLNRDHYVWETLSDESDVFYLAESRLRNQAHLPPYCHFAKISLRGRDEKRLFIGANTVYNKLHDNPQLEVYGPITDVPFKLRGYFYYSVIVKSKQKAPLYQAVEEITKHSRSKATRIAVQLR